MQSLLLIFPTPLSQILLSRLEHEIVVSFELLHFFGGEASMFQKQELTT
jgi:hypothetical protein